MFSALSTVRRPLLAGTLFSLGLLCLLGLPTSLRAESNTKAAAKRAGSAKRTKPMKATPSIETIRFQFFIKKAKLMPTKAGGKRPWDLGGNKADPYVTIKVGKWKYRSPQRRNNHNPEWKLHTPVLEAPLSAFVQIKLIDRDFGRHDTIAESPKNLTLGQMLRNKKGIYRWDRAESLEIEIHPTKAQVGSMSDDGMPQWMKDILMGGFLLLVVLLSIYTLFRIFRS